MSVAVAAATIAPAGATTKVDVSGPTNGVSGTPITFQFDWSTNDSLEGWVLSDTHVTINFGDGNFDTIQVGDDQLIGSGTADHAYASNGLYTIDRNIQDRE